MTRNDSMFTMLRAPVKQTVDFYEGQWGKHDDFYEDVTTATDFYVSLCDRMRDYFADAEIWFQENDEHPAGVFEHSTGLRERYTLKGYEDVLDARVDVLFVRGDLRHYGPILKSKAGRNAFKVYYSAGNYYCPPPEYGWDLVFVDDERHMAETRAITGAPVELFKKTCVDSYFPGNKGKAVDICFVCNAPQARLKGLGLFKEIMSKLHGEGIIAYCIGYKSQTIIDKFAGLGNVYFTGFIPRQHVGQLMGRCKVGLVLSGERDGSPRVIQEFLCSDLPVVVRTQTAASSHYINYNTGVSAEDEDIVNVVRSILAKHSFTPRTYFMENLRMDHAAEWLATKIKEHGGPVHNI